MGKEAQHCELVLGSWDLRVWAKTKNIKANLKKILSCSWKSGSQIINRIMKSIEPSSKIMKFSAPRIRVYVSRAELSWVGQKSIILISIEPFTETPGPRARGSGSKVGKISCMLKMHNIKVLSLGHKEGDFFQDYFKRLALFKIVKPW